MMRKGRIAAAAAALALLVVLPGTAFAGNGNPSSQQPVTPGVVASPPPAPPAPPPPPVAPLTPPALTETTTTQSTTQSTTPSTTPSTTEEGSIGQVSGSSKPETAAEEPTLVESATDALPFTGFQATLVLIAGALVAAAGLALRRIGRTQKS